MLRAFWTFEERLTLYQGDCRLILPQLAPNSVNCIVTSPPYFPKIRDYQADGQLGHELTMQAYIDALVGIFDCLWELLHPEGNVFLNLGDSYARARDKDGIKAKSLRLLPHRVAIALQDAGWIVRQDIVWEKPNVPPDGAKDRTSRSHEFVFHLTKSEHYAYDHDAIKEPCTFNRRGGDKFVSGGQKNWSRGLNSRDRSCFGDGRRNRRSVWRIATEPYFGAHEAVFPRAIPELGILCGCPEEGVVLDPFAGTGTTLEVALKLGRSAIGIEINPDSCGEIKSRILELPETQPQQQSREEALLS